MSKTPNPEDVPKLILSEIPLTVILKFIKPFDGSRDKLDAFINNCTNAVDICTPSQECIVFRYIISQLEGKAQAACSIKEFDKWPTLREFLRAQFGERKHYAHLLTDLQECRQNSTETINQFALRIESCLSQLLTEVSMSCPKKMELNGRLAAMEDLALNSFILGIRPNISNIVRCKVPKSLNDAINIAVSEEKIIQYSSKRYTHNTIPYSPSRPHAMHKRPDNKIVHNSYFRPNNLTVKQESGSSGPANIVCRYCKFPGHSIDQCRKREYNNKRFPAQQSSSRPVHYLDEGMDETDSTEHESSLN